MGQNSTGVSYNFGQMGSAYQNLAKPVYPPKGMVIVAIQFLADNTPTALITETLDTQGPQYFGTNDTEATAANYLGVTEAACTGARTTVNITNDTVTIGAENAKIKVGQYVLLVAQGDTDTSGITIDSETPIPITSGPNKQGVKVTSYGGGTTLTLDTQITPSTQGLIFLDDFHGAGGLSAGSQVFPKGVTIYGRWTTFTPSAAGVICYFGK